MNDHSEDSNGLGQLHLLDDSGDAGVVCTKGFSDAMGEGKSVVPNRIRKKSGEVICGGILPENVCPSSSESFRQVEGDLKRAELSTVEENNRCAEPKQRRRFSTIFLQHRDGICEKLLDINSDVLKRATETINVNLINTVKKKFEKNKKQIYIKESDSSVLSFDKEIKLSQKTNVFREENNDGSCESFKEKNPKGIFEEREASSLLDECDGSKGSESFEGNSKNQECSLELSNIKESAYVLNDFSGKVTTCPCESGLAVRQLAELGTVLSIEGKNDAELEQIFGLKSFEIRIQNLEEGRLNCCHSGQNMFDVAEPTKGVESCSEGCEKDSNLIDVPKLSENKDCKNSKGDLSENDGKEIGKLATSLNIRKEMRRSSPSRECYVCHRKLNDCIQDWRESLGPKSVYCSRKCVEKQVELAKEAVPSDYKITVLERSGMVLHESAELTSSTLFGFLISHPDFTPVLPTMESQFSTGEDTSRKSSRPAVMEMKGDKVHSKEADQKRLQVRRVTVEKLVERAQKTPDLIFTKSEVKNLVQKIEEQLFKECKQSITGRYRSWFKQFITNVTTKNNKGFYLRVLLGEISVQKLVSLDAHSLNSPYLSEPVVIPDSRKLTKCDEIDKGDDNTKHNLMHPKKKGKVEDKGLESTNATTSLKPVSCISAKKKLLKEPVSEFDKILGVELKDTTSSHKCHLYDLNCDICTGKRERDSQNRKRKLVEQLHQDSQKKDKGSSTTSTSTLRLENETVATDENADCITSVNISEDVDQTFSSVDSSEVSSGRKGTSWRSNTGVKSYEEIKIKEESWRQPWHHKNIAFGDSWRKTINEESESYFLPNGLMPLENKNGEKWDHSGGKSGTNSHKKRKHWIEGKKEDPRKEIEPINLHDEGVGRKSIWEIGEKRHIVWTGKLKMGQYFNFPATLSALNSESNFCLKNELPQVLQIVGRIEPRIVFNYISQLRKSNAKEIIILRLDHHVDSNMDEQFMKCFLDMERKRRYSVLDVSEHKMLKDGYLIALRSGKKLPTVLLPYNGPGISADHGDMIICVIVRCRSSVLAETVSGVTRAIKNENVAVDQRLPTDGAKKHVVEIPLESSYGASSPGTCMREFEASLESGSSIFNPEIPVKILEVQNFPPSNDTQSKRDELITESLDTSPIQIPTLVQDNGESGDKGFMPSENATQSNQETKPVADFPQPIIPDAEQANSIIKDASISRKCSETNEKDSPKLSKKIAIGGNLTPETEGNSGFGINRLEGAEWSNNDIGLKETIKSDEVVRISNAEKPSVLPSSHQGPRMSFPFITSFNIPAKIDLNICAPPPLSFCLPPPPPLPSSLSSTPSLSKNNICLPPPPEPPSDASQFCAPSTSEKNSSRKPNFASNQSMDFATSSAENGASIAVPCSSESLQCKATEPKINAGEMDMDICDDEDEEESGGNIELTVVKHDSSSFHCAKLPDSRIQSSPPLDFTVMASCTSPPPPPSHSTIKKTCTSTNFVSDVRTAPPLPSNSGKRPTLLTVIPPEPRSNCLATSNRSYNAKHFASESTVPLVSHSPENKRASLLGAYPQPPTAHNISVPRSENFYPVNAIGMRAPESRSVLEEDWDTGEFQRMKNFFDNEPSTSVDVDKFDNGNSSYCQNRKSYFNQDTNRPQYQLLDRRGVSGGIRQRHYFFNNAHGSYLKRRPKPEEECYDFPTEENYRNPLIFDRSQNVTLPSFTDSYMSRLGGAEILRRKIPPGSSPFARGHLPLGDYALPKKFTRGGIRGCGRAGFRH